MNAFANPVVINPVTDNESSVTRWFTGLNSKPEARIRIFAFPFAGGDISAFHRWNGWLPNEIELVRVQLPERGVRQNEKAPNNMDDLVEQLCSAFIQLEDLPSIFFGYSMGGLIAYAIILRLIEQGLQRPRLFCVAACNPPHLHRLAWDAMSDNTLINVLFGSDPTWSDAIPSEKIQANLKLIRKDLSLCQNFLQTNKLSNSMLDCPITTFSAQQDTIAAPEDILNWRSYTSSSCVSHRLGGGHFFLFNSQSDHLSLLLLREMQQLERKLN